MHTVFSTSKSYRLCLLCWRHNPTIPSFKCSLQSNHGYGTLCSAAIENGNIVLTIPSPNHIPVTQRPHPTPTSPTNPNPSPREQLSNVKLYELIKTRTDTSLITYSTVSLFVSNIWYFICSLVTRFIQLQLLFNVYDYCFKCSFL